MTDVIYFSTRNVEIPRIVAAKLKRQLKIKIGFNDCGGKIRISGDLRIVDGSFRHLRYAEVRDGCLVLYRYVGNNRVWDFRMALYNLNINLDSPKYYCQFSLSRFGEIIPIVTFQVVKEQTYKKWLKCLAVEIIRQTPLNTLKFMDVLFINELLEKRQDAKVTLKSKPADEKRLNGNSCQLYKDLDNDYNDSLNISCTCNKLSPPIRTASSRTFERENHFQCCPDLPDDRVESNYSFDSGYCSLQSAYSTANKYEALESETENHHVAKKPFEELFSKFECQQQMKPFKTKTKNYHRNNSNDDDDDDDDDNNNNLIYNNSNNNGTENLVLHHRSCNLQNASVTSEGNSRNIVEIVSNSTAASTRTFWPTIYASTNVDCYDCRHFKPQSSYQTYITPKPDKFDLKEKSFSQGTKTHGNLRINVRSINSIPDVLKDLPDTFPRSKRKPPSVSFHLSKQMVQNEYESENISASTNASLLIRLITKCQIDKEYVPVKEKRMLFESLSRLSFSVDNLRKRVKCAEHSYLTKCRSLCDLNVNHVPVSVMKTYFESFNQTKDK